MDLDRTDAHLAAETIAGAEGSDLMANRGAAYPMAADLAGAPRTGLNVQLCGDAHLSNFGAFAAPDRRLVFSVDDFEASSRDAPRLLSLLFAYWVPSNVTTAMSNRHLAASMP